MATLNLHSTDPSGTSPLCHHTVRTGSPTTVHLSVVASYSTYRYPYNSTLVCGTFIQYVQVPLQQYTCLWYHRTVRIGTPTTVHLSLVPSLLQGLISDCSGETRYIIILIIFSIITPFVQAPLQQYTCQPSVLPHVVSILN